MGFSSTASYFKTRAGRTKDAADRARLREVATFYKRLAGVLEDFPAGFAAAPLSAPRAERWKNRAVECRTLADHVRAARCRAQLLELAQTYEQLSSAAE